jgi:hypothetical protein
VTLLGATAAYQLVVATVGASLHRDAVDKRLVDDLKSLGQRGQTVHDPAEMGGFDDLVGGPASVDSDGDGLPDAWETAHGLNPQVPDSNELATTGRTQLEEYLNWLTVPHSTTAPGSPSVK